MSTRKKILHVLWSGGIGGTEEYVTSLASHLDPVKYQVALCFLSGKGPIYEEALRIKNFNTDFIGIKNGFDIINIFRFARYLHKKRFDIIHLHIRNFLSMAVVSLVAPKALKIITHHVGPGDITLIRKSKMFYKLFSRCFRKITAISKAVKENMIRDFGITEPGKIEVIYNGIDMSKFNNNAIPSDLLDIRKTGRYVIGFVGRMQYFKRPRLFVDIAANLIKKDNRFYFIMVGDGPELKKCEEMINQYGINENVKLLGFRRDIPNILSSFDAMLFTSVGEGFGIVLIEAMAMGTPVFAVNDGAVSEIVTHNENGILFDTTDPELIAQQILKFLLDEKLMRRIRGKGIEDVHAKFSIETCVRQMENLYEKIWSDAGV